MSYHVGENLVIKRKIIGCSIMAKITIQDDFCRSDVQIELQIHDKICLLTKRVLRAIFWIGCYDPLFICKISNIKQASSLDSSLIRDKNTHGRRGLRLEDNTQDRWRKFITIFVTYALIKFFGAGISRIIITRLENSKSDENLESNNIWINLNKLNKVIGDPLSTAPELVVLIYIALSYASLTAICALPYYFIIKPMDAAQIRFILDPLRETKRIDLIINQKLDIVLESMGHFRLQVMREHGRLNLNFLVATEKLHQNLEKNDQQISIVKTYKQHHQILRPRIYSAEWYGKICHITLLWLSLFYAFLAFVAIPISIYLYWFFFNSKCESSGIVSDCNLFMVFNWPDIVMLLEIQLNIMLCYLSYSLIMIIFANQVLYQLKLTKNIREDLKQCQRFMRLSNQQQQGNFKDQKLILSTDSILIETLIKYWVFDNDIKRSVKFMSILLSFFLIQCGSLSLACFVTKTMTATLAIDLSTVLLIFNWFGINIFITLCAFMFAEICSIRRVVWSIIAEISLRNFKLNNRTTAIRDDTITQLWRRFAHSDGNIEKDYAVQPFNMILTYKRSLEVNFFILTLASLSLNY